MLVEEVGGGSDGDDEPSKDHRNGSGKIHGLERRVNSNEQLKLLFNKVCLQKNKSHIMRHCPIHLLPPPSLP